jgi:hypothetical protein
MKTGYPTDETCLRGVLAEAEFHRDGRGDDMNGASSYEWGGCGSV